MRVSRFAVPGSFVNVKIDAAEDFDLYGKIVQPKQTASLAEALAVHS